ncbi:hypothetical protein PV349_32600, partial [Streptomyces sp. WI04-05A]|uniref:hypothetical protein n=1 Tax=Streptomyces sp. WI04-05A TaxID=3028707 RepID=UPI0029ACB644
EVDHPAARRAVRTGVEVLAVEVGEEDVAVARVALDELLGLLGRQDEALPQNVGPLKGLPAVGYQSDAEISYFKTLLNA